MKEGNKCLLCDYEQLRKSHVYYEDDTVIIVDVLPENLYHWKRKIMVVLKRHTVEATFEEILHAIQKLNAVAETFGQPFRLRIGMLPMGDHLASAPDHWHYHAVWQ